MFDFHMHTTVSFDGRATPEEMVRAAEAAGLQEICFTDHIDYESDKEIQTMVFDIDQYRAAYDRLQSDRVKIRRGMEFGLKEYNADQLRRDLKRYDFDYVIGSVHFVDELDVYFAPYWNGKTVFEGERRFLEQTLACVEAHEDFDALGHLTYLSKTRGHPDPKPILYQDHKSVVDAILTILAKKEKGMEINTSGVDRCGAFLPDAEYVLRFQQLGGRIVTVGSDAHDAERVGQYTLQACTMLKEIFGYVCTYQNRKPVFHHL